MGREKINKIKETGVSPVIGVILMVAVTVALVALVTIIVFDIGGDVSENPRGSVQLSYDNNQAEATVLRNDNIDTFEIINQDSGNSVIINGNAGNSKTIGVSEGDKIIVNAIMPDGSEQVLRTGTATDTGTVSGSLIGVRDGSDNSNIDVQIDNSNNDGTSKAILTANYATLSGSKSDYKIELEKESSSNILICDASDPDNAKNELDETNDCNPSGSNPSGSKESQLYSSDSYSNLDTSNGNQAGTFIIVVPDIIDSYGTYQFNTDLIYKPTGNKIGENTFSVDVSSP